MQTSYVYTMHVDTYAFISKLRGFWFTTLTSALWTCALRDRLCSPGSQSQKDAKPRVFPLPFTDYMLIKETCLFPAPEEAEMKWTQNCPAICIPSFLCDNCVYLVPVHWLLVLILALEPSQEHEAGPGGAAAAVLRGDGTSVRPCWVQKPSPQTGAAGSPEHFQPTFVACLEFEEFLV